MYRSVDDAMLLRAAVLRPDQLEPWPDATDSDPASAWLPWLTTTLSALPGFAAAFAHASPDLFERVAAVMDGRVSRSDARAVVFAVMRYLLRATTRATPFGLFAGVAPATTSRSGSLRWGAAHQPIARLHASWLTAIIDRLETDPCLQPNLMVRANNLVVERGDTMVLEFRAATTDPRGAPAHLRVTANDVVRAALAVATQPIRIADLIGTLVADGAAPPDGAQRLVAQMVAQRLLLTNLRPPSTATDPLTHLISQAPTGMHGASAVPLLDQLRHIQDLKSRHDRTTDRATAEALRRELQQSTAALHTGPAVGIDLRLDGDLVLPTTVTAEACRAASALTRLARPACAAWRSWHARFLDRYGLYALVPLLDAVDAQVGLGYPDNVAGEPADSAAVLSDRDRQLTALAQRAALHRQREVTLDDALIEKLAGATPSDIMPTGELTVRVHAGSLRAVADGDFQLSVVRAGAQAFSTAGRFLDMFDEATRQRMATRVAGSPAASMGAGLAQLSSVTRYTISVDVNRAVQVLPAVIPVGEYHAASPAAIGLDDIAVTADRHRLYLVSVSRQQALQPVAINAVDPVRHAHPLARFLTEASVAFAAGCSPVQWGPAALTLPFLPALRYGRTLLSPARWLLGADDLPGRDASRHQWEQALTAWRETIGCPAEVALGVGDQSLGLDLNEPAHRALLRDHLSREPRALLRHVPHDDAWLGGHRHEIVIPLHATTPRPPAPRLTSTPVNVRTQGRLPGSGPHYVKIYARPSEQAAILTTRLPRLLAELPDGGRWWYLRHHDPEPHLRLRISGLPLDTVTDWTRELAAADLTRRVQWDTDFGEPGRFGGPDAYRATTAVFTADSAAALAELAVARRGRGPAWQAVTAASMVDIVTAVIGNPHDGLRWLTDHTRSHRPAPARDTYDQAIRLANPYDRSALTALPGGGDLIGRWAARRRALTRWREDLPAVSSIPAADLLPDLLHLHHVRVAGIDLDSERACLHLARAAALSWTTRSTR